MAFTLAELVVRLGWRSNDFDRGLNRSRRNIEDLRGSLNGVERHSRRFLIAAGAGVSYFLKAASDAQETVNKFEIVFGDQADEAKKFSEQLAGSINRSEYEIQSFMARIQDTLVPMGMAREGARELSQQIVALAYDLSSFNNISTREAMDRLTSGLVGNHEATRMLGIGLSQASLDMELMARGQKRVAQGATELQKMLARLAIITRSSKDAIGDAARTTDEFANRVRALQADVNKLAVVMGNELLPVAEDAVGALSELARRYTEMSDGQRQSTITTGTFAVSTAAMAYSTSKGAQAVGSLAKGISALSARVGAGAGPLGVLIALTTAYASALATSRIRGEEFGETLLRIGGSVTGLTTKLSNFESKMSREQSLNSIVRGVEGAINRPDGSVDLGAAESGLERLRKEMGRVKKEIDSLDRTDSWTTKEKENARNLMMEYDRLRQMVSRLNRQIDEAYSRSMEGTVMGGLGAEAEIDRLTKEAKDRQDFESRDPMKDFENRRDFLHELNRKILEEQNAMRDMESQRGGRSSVMPQFSDPAQFAKTIQSAITGSSEETRRHAEAMRAQQQQINELKQIRDEISGARNDKKPSVFG